MRRPTWLMAFVPENNLREINETNDKSIAWIYIFAPIRGCLNWKPQSRRGVKKWFAKTEMRREWEAMNTAPDRHHEPHGGTNVCYSLFWSSHAHIIPTQIHRNTQDNFLARLFHVCYCLFWSPTPPPLKISCTVLRVVTGETTRGIPKTYPKLWDRGIVVSNDYPLLSHKKSYHIQRPNFKV